MIRAEKLTKRFGQLVALDSVDFTVEPGEVLGFLGPNGAGKSTSLRILSGFLPPSGGRASIAGHDLGTDSLKARAATGYLPENFTAPSDLRVCEYLRYRGALKGTPRRELPGRVEMLAERLGLTDRLRQPFASLSKGYRQRVGLADALLANPPALLLDEPFSGLDPLQRQDFRDVLRELASEGKAVLFSSHVLPEVEDLADRVLVLHHGRACAAGTLPELRQTVDAETLMRVRLEVAVAELPAQIAAAANELRVEIVDAQEDELLLRVADVAARDALFRWLAAEELPVAEFVAQRPDLDHLFRTLVGGDAA